MAESASMLSELMFGGAALLTAFSTIYAIYSRNRVKQARQEIKTVQAIHLDQIPDKLKFLAEWALFENKVVKLLRETEIDRFIFFRCWNGLYDPKWTTAIYQYEEEGEEEKFSFKLVPFDDDYLCRFVDMKQNGFHEIQVKAMPPSLIKNIYDAEQLKVSIWFHVKTDVVSETISAHAYFSAASRTAEAIAPTTKARLQDLAWELSKILESV